MARYSDFDRRAMGRVLELAEKGANTTHPNPRVGCVIAKDEKILAEGFHERAGGPHGEAAAFLALAAGAGMAAAEGATAYVNLEPCSHYGRTPPCADALVKARVARVVFSIADPNPRVAGGGAARLEQAGIKVDVGLMAAEAEEINAGFLRRMRTGRPFVRVKVGMSLDGRTALASGESKWITSEAAREDVQYWRARSSAILTGIGTVLADDPQMNVRLPNTWRQPAVVVLDPAARMPAAARLFGGGGPVIVFTKAGAQPGGGALEAKGARIQQVPGADAREGARPEVIQQQGDGLRQPVAQLPPGSSRRERLDLGAVLSKLGELEINEVLVEAGATLTGALVREGLADELLLYIAPKLLGPDARPLMLDYPAPASLQEAGAFEIMESVRVGPDLRLRLRRPS